MSVLESSGEGDVNITGDDDEEEVPGNEKIDDVKLHDVDAIHHFKVWPDGLPYNSHTRNPFLDDWPYVHSKPEIYEYVPPPRLDPLPTFDWHDYEPRSLDFTIPPPDLPTPPEYPTGHSISLPAFGVSSVIALLILAATRSCKRSRPGSVQYRGVVGAGAAQQHLETDMTPSGQGGSVQYRGVVGAGAAQQHLETDMTPSGQGEADPLYIDMPPPYSDCNNMNVSEEPPKYSELLPHNDCLVEIGFRNECVDMTTTPNASGDVNTEFVSDNDRTVERLSLDQKETAENTRRADDRDNVMYVDEKSMPDQRAK